MPVQFHETDNYDEHQNLMNSLKGKDVFCWYVAAIVKETGKSWCPDCTAAEPVVRDYLNNLQIKEGKDVHVIYVTLEKDYYKSGNCEFRQDPKINLQKVPTLLNPVDLKVLVEGDCLDKKKLDILFEDIKV